MKEYCKNFTFGNFHIPKYMESGINLYINEGIKGGSFLNAIISNDLTKAVMYADRVNMMNIPAYVAFFYNHAPSECWGSVEKATKWVEIGGLNDSANEGTSGEDSKK